VRLVATATLDWFQRTGVASAGLWPQVVLRLGYQYENPNPRYFPIRLDGEDVSGRDFDDLAGVRNRKIGFIFQSFNLIPVLDVTENVEFPLMVRPQEEPLAAQRARVRALAVEVGLEQYLTHTPDELSGGQRLAAGRRGSAPALSWWWGGAAPGGVVEPLEARRGPPRERGAPSRRGRGWGPAPGGCGGRCWGAGGSRLLPSSGVAARRLDESAGEAAKVLHLLAPALTPNVGKPDTAFEFPMAPQALYPGTPPRTAFGRMLSHLLTASGANALPDKSSLLAGRFPSYPDEAALNAAFYGAPGQEP
jgi:hypothetical protein